MQALLIRSLVALLAAGAALAGGEALAQKPPIKIGVLAPQTGPLSANGKEMINGFVLFNEKHGNKLAGREVRLIVEDSEGKPQSALTKARALVESQGVHCLVGPQSSSEGYALLPFIDGRKVPALFSSVAAEDITQRRRSPYIVRTGWSAGQPGHPFGKYAHDTLHYNKIAVIAYDFAFGHESVAGFQRTFEDAGGQVVQKLWPPLGTADYAPYLAQLKRDVDAVYAAFSGNDALRFARQYADAGLKERLPLIGSGNFTDEHVLRTMGDEAIGIVTALHYSAALQTPANKKFAATYEAKYRQVPSYYSEGTYVAGMALKAALEATGGDIENVDRFLSALRKVDLSDAPRGPVRFDEYGSPIQNIYIRKVEKVGGRLQNTVVQTIPNVSQFGPYKAEEYLKNPVYSRDYPPCRHC